MADKTEAAKAVELLQASLADPKDVFGKRFGKVEPVIAGLVECFAARQRVIKAEAMYHASSPWDDGLEIVLDELVNARKAEASAIATVCKEVLGHG